MLSTLYNGVQDQVDQAIELLTPSVQPLFGAEDGVLASSGSGVLLGVRGRRFLASAEHTRHNERYVALVRSDNVASTPAIGSDAKFVSIRPHLIDEHRDIGCAELDSDITTRLLPDPLFQSESNVLTRTPDSSRGYLVLGYPSSLQKLDFPRAYVVRPHGFVAIEALDAYAALEHKGVARSTHLVLTIDRAIAPVWHERVVLKGISGGGLWLLGDMFRRVTPDNPPRLVGIVTRYILEPTPVLVALRIGAILDLISHN
jgi:hypothetical protein